MAGMTTTGVPSSEQMVTSEDLAEVAEEDFQIASDGRAVVTNISLIYFLSCLIYTPTLRMFVLLIAMKHPPRDQLTAVANSVHSLAASAHTTNKSLLLHVVLSSHEQPSSEQRLLVVWRYVRGSLTGI